jgi:hypothetical protein
LLKTLRKKELFNVISLKEEVRRLFVRLLEWIIILKILSRLLPNLEKSLVVVVRRLQMKFMVNVSQYRVMLNTIYGTSLILIKN